MGFLFRCQHSYKFPLLQGSFSIVSPSSRSAMASKLLNQLRTSYKTNHKILSHPLTNPNANFSAKCSILPSPSPQIPLQARSYSDVLQANCNPKSDENVNRASISSSSLNEAELAKFSAIAETWWDADGPFKPLHAMNPTRLSFIRSTLCRHFGKDPYSPRPFEGLKFVDVGCGGGILSEPLARMGATITGIDAVEKNIKIARLHSDLDPITSSIDYRCATAEKLVEEGLGFDAVIASEVIEHVANPDEFCESLSALTVSSGATVISTINRSVRSYAAAIVAAEYILHWLPKGTHQWSSFLTPEELVMILQRASVSVREMAGFAYNPLMGQWSLSDDVGVNFIAFGTKNGP